MRRTAPAKDTIEKAAAKLAQKLLKDKHLLSLYIYYTVYFLSIGLTVYATKYFGEIGLSDSQIGLITAVPAFAALFLQPLWGSLADRAKYMRSVLIGALAIASVFCFLEPLAVGNYWLLLIVLTLFSAFTLPALPVGNAISIEYTGSHGYNFGPVRMMGTVGYQVSILVMGFVFSASLKNLYPVLGAMTLVAAASARLLPPVRGFQHDKERISFTVFFKNPDLRMLFIVVFLGQLAGQFSIVFFSKHLGDLGVSNSLTGVISTLAVSLEIPFLLFADRLMKKLPIWTWMWIGLAVNSVRFLALSVVRAPGLILAAQILSVFQLSCFEFFPFVYLGRIAPKELLSTVQSTYQMVAFGVSRIVSSLLGGLIADYTGIHAVFGINGALLLAAAVLLFVPLRRRAKRDGVPGEEE